MVSAAGRQFHGWLDVINNRPINDTSGELDQFLKEHYPSRPKTEHYLDELNRMRTGGLDVKRVEEDSDTRYVAFLRDRTGRNFKRVVMEVGAEEPWPITKLEVEAAPTPPEFATPRMTEPEAIEAFRQYLDEEAVADRFSGAVLVAKGGETLFSEGYGLQDREHNIPNTTETRFNSASMGKIFTAVATLQLVQKGLLDLAKPIGRYLPEYPDKEAAAKVTAHHLLTHTSGVSSDVQAFWANAHRLHSLEDHMATFGALGLEFEPGAKWSYTNYGFMLLGLLVQRVANQDYYEYIQEHVFVPAGMTSTSYDPDESTAVGYPGAGGTRPERGGPAGGVPVSVVDFKRFADAFITHRLLDASHTDLMVRGQIAAGILGRQEAYGWETAIENGARCLSRSGSGATASGELRIYPDSGYVVVALANITAPAAITMTTFIGDRLPGP